MLDKNQVIIDNLTFTKKNTQPWLRRPSTLFTDQKRGGKLCRKTLVGK